MRVALLSPPHFAFEQPYLSLPALTAFLRERGVAVSQDDLGIRALDHFTRPAVLAGCVERLERRLARARRRSTPVREDDRAWAAGRALLAAPQVLAGIERAVDYFRSPDRFADFEPYTPSERLVQEAFTIVSAVHHPTQMLLMGAARHCSAEASVDVLRAVEDEAHNPYRPLFESYVADTLRPAAPDLVGLSITTLTQIIPGFTLAHVIRQALPGTKIVIGGVMPNLLADQIRRLPGLFVLFDYLVRSEGETPLWQLCRHLAGECPVTEVPNLVYRQDGRVEDTGVRSKENVNQLPTPDYDGLSLDRYLAPMPVLSLEPARGCYWRKCTFCNQYAIHENTYRVRRPEKTAADMARLQADHGVRFFNIVNEGLPARHLSMLGEAIVQTGVKAHWYAGARLERAFTRERVAALAEAGCRRLLFGLESGSQRVLDLMKKGVRLQDVPAIAAACKAAGVDVHFYLMAGFPTETEAEMRQTQEFVLRHLPEVDQDWFTFVYSIFVAALDTPILDELPRLGYRVVPRGGKYDLELLREHHPVDPALPRIPRARLEEISREITAAIYARLPPRRFPEEVTHYMAFRSLHEAPPAPAARVEAPAPRAGVFRDGHRFQVSPWLTVRRLPVVPGRRAGGHVAYDVRADRCYVLDPGARRLLEALRSPRSLRQLRGRRPSGSATVRRLRERLADLASRGVLQVEAPTPRIAAGR